ncbi:site-specific DNA-methyltransferase [Glycomyces sambucus]|uniref:site-specific DNA-methyltransferase n=1 Tax=Glycomyces sambucus TaxID=380244 RepID=UPI00115FFF88|nr:site-specific DNA-methyltransferase [Glycomyces sambucus]
MTRLELMWPNKDRFLLVPKDDEGKPVWVDRNHPAAAEVRVSELTTAVGGVKDADPHADNLLFTGDSLDVLRILAEVPEYRRVYRGKIKQVYIDPPFNTGQTFDQYDDWLEHATWLSFMHERLILIRELLSDTGSVWVHLDDVEQHRMRALLDEVFGASNFVTTVIWQKIHARNNSAMHFSADHDFITVYAKDATKWRSNRVARTEKSDSDFWNPDEDSRGPWRRSDMTASKAYKDGHYEVVGPHGDVFKPRPGRPWATSEENFAALVADNRIWWGKNGRSFPFRKRFKSELGNLVPTTVWLHEEVGNNREAKAEIAKLFEQDSFSTPKPERLLERIIHISSDPADIVLDCFAGSGSTAAVAHKMGRRWVTAEVSPETVETFTRPRLELVVKGEDQGGITKAVGWERGGGFRCVEVGPSMYIDTPVGVLLSDAATNGTFARAVAGQLGYEFQPDAAPLCGFRGRMRLAVLDGTVGEEEVRAVVSKLNAGERVEIVGRSILDGAAATLVQLAKGSKITKAPRDLLTKSALRLRRRASREVGE